MDSGRWTEINKIQTRHQDMPSQSSLQSCPPKEESKDVHSQDQSCHSSESILESSKGLLPLSKRTRIDDSHTMSIHHSETLLGGIRPSKKNYRANRPERLDMSTILDSSPPSLSFSPTHAPRHASEPDMRFFPSPRSVLERRTSTGSFF